LRSEAESGFHLKSPRGEIGPLERLETERLIQGATDVPEENHVAKLGFLHLQLSWEKVA